MADSRAEQASPAASLSGGAGGARIRGTRREARLKARHALADLELEHALGVVRVLDERVDARPVDDELAPVDAHAAVAVEHRPRAARLVGPGVGPFLVAGLGLQEQARLVL